MRRKLLSIILVITFVLGFTLMKSPARAETKEAWDTERYGDVLDIGPVLRNQEKDSVYRNKLDEQIKEAASKINLDEGTTQDDTTADSDFTFDGGTKWMLGYDIYGYYLKTFTLRSVGQNVEVWVADDLSYEDDRPLPVITQEQVDLMRDVFDATVYPTDTSFFGTPDSHTGDNAVLPGMVGLPDDYYVSGDGVERVMLLVDTIRDENYYDSSYPFIIGGFYSSTYEAYFDRNIINIDSQDWENRLERDWLPTTAHEFQHLIHDDNDPAEESWINEGMSDFAEYLCFGEHPWGHVNFFLDHPENSLVEWDEHYSAETGPETLADYGQAYLFQLYLNDHYGMDLIQALAKNGAQGIESVNQVLSDFGTGIDFEELFRRFTVALAIDNMSPGDGIYNFDSIDLEVNYASALEYDKDGVPAWGADYKVIDDPSKIQAVIFDGINFMDTPWKVVDDPLGSGEKVLWGNNGNLKDNMAVIGADLTGVGSATLTFDNFIDIEEGWDAGIVQVSTDGGDTWTSLANENTVGQDEFPPNDQAMQIYNNLPGFTGYYDEWTPETFDLTPYAGQNILVNFRYMTDGAYNDSGWFIDNIEIPEIGYTNDCSSMDGFKSIDEIKGIYVEYAVTFINEKSLGKGKNNPHYQVLNIDPFKISENDTETLKGFLTGGKNYMIVWYAAPIGKNGSVPFTYEIIRKSDANKKKGSTIGEPSEPAEPDPGTPPDDGGGIEPPPPDDGDDVVPPEDDSDTRGHFGGPGGGRKRP